MFKKYFVFMLFLVVFAIGSEEYQTRGIEVTGKATIEVVSDQFLVNFSAFNQNVNANSGKLMVDNASELLIDYALSLGVLKNNIQSTKLRIYTTYYQSTVDVEEIELLKKLSKNQVGKVHINSQSLTQNNKTLNYHISRDISMEIDNIEIYEKLISRASKIGGFNLAPIDMSYSQADSLYQKALALALDNAKQKASKLAKEAGRGLGDLLYLKEVSRGYVKPMMMHSKSSDSFSAHIGKQNISAQVIATYSLL